MVCLSPEKHVSNDDPTEEEIPTVQECTSEVDTDVPIPGALADTQHFSWNAGRIQFFKAMADTILITEPHDDFGHTQQEGLSPELEQFALILEHVALIADLSRCL